MRKSHSVGPSFQLGCLEQSRHLLGLPPGTHPRQLEPRPEVGTLGHSGDLFVVWPLSLNQSLLLGGRCVGQCVPMRL